MYKMDLCRIFVLSKATYGWINRFPPEATANRLFNALTKMNNTNKMANPCIRATLYGGNTHCHPVIGLRMFKRLARMRSSLLFLWSAPVAFRRVALETPKWTSRDSNHHRQSVNAGKTNAIPIEPSGRLRMRSSLPW